MTVHGAKGLEADVVFLADTGGAIGRPAASGACSSTSARIATIRRSSGGASKRRRRSRSATRMRSEDAETEQEYLRLLYVAMTRARDVLYVAGVRLLTAAGAQLVHDRARCARAEGRATSSDEEGELAAPFQWPQSLRAPLGAEAETPLPRSMRQREPPAWLTRAAPTPAAGAAAAASLARSRRA